MVSKMKNKIDFVMIWVDGSDPKWLMEKEKYNPNQNTDSSNIRYRDWDNLKYWFRGVEKYAPWVNKIYFVTCGHVPSWLNLDHPKLELIKHEDYMKQEYLPTFSSHPIELNLHQIKGLSEQFVYFNDDTFIINPTKESDFFQNGLPCDSAVITPFVTGENSVSNHIILNDFEFVNQNFELRTVLMKSLFKWINPLYGFKNFRTLMMMFYHRFPGLAIQHLPSSFLKSSFEEVWDEHYSLLDRVSKNKFRSKEDINQYVIKFWQLCTGRFMPRKYSIGKNFMITDHNEEIVQSILKNKFKLLCINDNADLEDFEKSKCEINSAFEKKLPHKSLFEK